MSVVYSMGVSKHFCLLGYILAWGDLSTLPPGTYFGLGVLKHLPLEY